DSGPGSPVAMILPHRGSPLHLRSALSSLTRAWGADLRIRVGLDVDEAAGYVDFAREFPSVEFFRATPAPLGPYVIRQDLAKQSPEALLSLQDSDDLSTSDRFAVLHREMVSTGCDMVGSHALYLDQIRRQVCPARFPVDASGALADRPNHAQLHATVMVKRD